MLGSGRPGCARAAGNDDALELFDLLQDAVFGDFEVLQTQVGDRGAVERRVDVDADVVGLGAERGNRRRLGWRLLILSSGEDRDRGADRNRS